MKELPERGGGSRRRCRIVGAELTFILSFGGSEQRRDHARGVSSRPVTDRIGDVGIPRVFVGGESGQIDDVARVTRLGDGCQRLRGFQAIPSISETTGDEQCPARDGGRRPDTRVVPHARWKEGGAGDAKPRTVVFRIAPRVRRARAKGREQLLDTATRMDVPAAIPSRPHGFAAPRSGQNGP